MCSSFPDCNNVFRTYLHDVRNICIYLQHTTSFNATYFQYYHVSTGHLLLILRRTSKAGSDWIFLSEKGCVLTNVSIATPEFIMFCPDPSLPFLVLVLLLLIVK